MTGSESVAADHIVPASGPVWSSDCGFSPAILPARATHDGSLPFQEIKDERRTKESRSRILDHRSLGRGAGGVSAELRAGGLACGTWLSRQENCRTGLLACTVRLPSLPMA